MSIEFPKSAAAHIKPKKETIITKDDGSFKKVKDYNEYDELNNYVDEHKQEAVYKKSIKKDNIDYDKKRGKAKGSKPKTKENFKLNYN